MRDDKDDTFHVHDGFVGIWSSKIDDVDLLGAMRRFLRSLGFAVSRDRRLAHPHYRLIYDLHDAGGWKSLRFHMDLCGYRLALTFFDDVPIENHHGGRYTFNKLSKMPYLTRLRAEWAIRRVREFLTGRGFRDHSEVVPEGALARCMYRRADLAKFHRGYYDSPPEKYNAQDMDGVLLRDGMKRWFRTPNGHLVQGTVYHNINNMWWFVVNDSELHNMASFELFTYKPGVHPRKASPRAASALRSALNAAVRRMDFERAIVIREALKRKGLAS